MNEQIKALAQQAGENIPEFHFGDWNIPNEFIQKFAQLIVSECMEQLNISNVPTSISAGLNLGRVAIKEHFGIEE